MVERKRGEQALRGIVEGYLSREHRDSPGQGCIIAALGTSIARQPHSVREVVTKELKGVFEFLAQLMPEDASPRHHDDAIVAFASMVGALILARAVNDESLSDRILRATTKRVTQRTKVRGPARRTRGN